MVFMSVRDDKALQLMYLRLDIGDVGDDKVNAQHISARKRQAAIHDNHRVFRFNGGNIHSNLIQSSERNNLHGTVETVFLLLPLVFTLLNLHRLRKKRKILGTVFSFYSFICFLGNKGLCGSFRSFRPCCPRCSSRICRFCIFSPIYTLFQSAFPGNPLSSPIDCLSRLMLRTFL